MTVPYRLVGFQAVRDGSGGKAPHSTMDAVTAREGPRWVCSTRRRNLPRSTPTRSTRASTRPGNSSALTSSPHESQKGRGRGAAPLHRSRGRVLPAAMSGVSKCLLCTEMRGPSACVGMRSGTGGRRTGTSPKLPSGGLGGGGKKGARHGPYGQVRRHERQGQGLCRRARRPGERGLGQGQGLRQREDRRKV